MYLQLISYIRGYVTLEVEGTQIEALLNEASSHRLMIWNIKRTAEHKAEMNIHIKHFFLLRPILKRTACRIHVLQRHGFPFLLDKLEKRKFFAAGIICFVIGLYLLSTVVWQVGIEGNHIIAESDIIAAAQKQGIYPLQWKFRMKDPDTLSRNLLGSLPGAAWIGVEIHGGLVQIKVVETSEPDKKPLMSPRNLISAMDAVITEIRALKGTPLVKIHTRVKKGQILISGTIGNETNHQIVVADGMVRGLVWHEFQIEVPLVQRFSTYTGNSKMKQYAVIGSRALQTTGYGKIQYEQFTTITRRVGLHWRNFSLPIGWMTEQIMEVKLEERHIDPSEAKKIGLEQARTDLLSQSGKDTKITEENILHERIENGKVYLTVHYEAEQELAVEQPIF